MKTFMRSVKSQIIMEIFPPWWKLTELISFRRFPIFNSGSQMTKATMELQVKEMQNVEPTKNK